MDGQLQKIDYALKQTDKLTQSIQTMEQFKKLSALPLPPPQQTHKKYIS